MPDCSLRHSLLLTLTALIWGVAFVAQSEASNYMGSCTFTGLRFLIAAAALFPFILLSRKRRPTAAANGGLWRSGVICGTLLCVASLLQQEGIAQGAGAGKAGFITTIYIVLVPVLNRFVFRKKIFPAIWLGVGVATAGLYLLCVKDTDFSLGFSDVLLILCAFAYSFQILAIDRFSPRYDALKLAAIQFLSCGVLSCVLMLFRDIAPAGFSEWASVFHAREAWIPLLYAAILSSAVGYTLQIVGQKGLNPTLASLLMSLESVFAVVAGWVILRQSLTPRELLGCLLVLAAVVLAQLAPQFSSRRRQII